MIGLVMTCRDMKSNPALWPHCSHLYARWMVGYKWYKMLMTCALNFDWCGDDNHWINSMQNKWLNLFFPAVFILEAIQEMVMINKWSLCLSPPVAQLVRDTCGVWVHDFKPLEKKKKKSSSFSLAPARWVWLQLWPYQLGLITSECI